MASVQERLQSKRVPVENWSISERLYLASAVACSGDQNWMSVSRSLKLACGSNNRPSDWFSQKSCAAQYEVLLGNVEPTKRKKRNEKDTSQTVVETPIQLIVRKLTQERIAELNKLIQEQREEYQKLRNEIAGIHNNVYDENQLREMLHQIENEEKQREREKLEYAQFVKEREERKREIERTWRSNTNLHQSPSSNIHSPTLTQHLNQKIKVEEMEVDDPNAKQGTSPLLTSLLKSPSAAPNPSSSILHNIANQQTRVAAPTITNLLTGSVTNLSGSLASTPQAGTKTTIATSGTAITTPYPTSMHNQPLTGPGPHDHSMGNIAQSPSQAAPTLSMLLENKQKENSMKVPPLTRIDSQNSMCSMDQHSSGDIATKTEPSDVDFNNAESPIKDEDQQLMDVFNELIPDDMGELDDIILDDLINEVQVAGDSHAAENLEGQVNLDLKNFQSQPAHATEAAVIKDEPSNVSENTCDSTAANTKVEDPFDELKESCKTGNEEKVPPVDLPKDDDSDLSNDTPLSELMKQETSAKQQRAQNQAPTEISLTTEAEQPDEAQCEAEQQHDQTVEPEESNELAQGEKKVEDNVDLIDNRSSEQEGYLESIQTDEQQQQNDFELKLSESEEKPNKVEIGMPIDSFESDSNDEKSMENIKREIEALPELKDSNSSENSQDEKIGIEDSELIEGKVDTDNVDEQPKEEPVDENVEPDSKPADDDGDGESVEQSEESVVEIKTGDEKEENIDSISIKDDITDLTTTTDEPIEQNEPEEVLSDTEAEKIEPVESEKVESAETEPCQVENVESSEQESKVEQAADSTAAETVVEILDDDILDEDECIQDAEAQSKDDEKIEPDSMQGETDDLIEIKSDDEKQEEGPTEEKSEKVDEPVPTTKVDTQEIPESCERKEKSVTPAPTERKVSTDDELFEDAKETLDIEVKPPKPVTPAIICDTDDDSPIEVVKEEKVGVKRDYSRRKKDQSHNEKRNEEPTPSEDTGGSISSRLRLKDRDRSESPFIDEDSGEPAAKSKRRYSTTPVIDSLPNSPASSDDREYRSWKKSILLLYNSLSSHRCASTFAKPITEDQAPNYKTIILNPMDLQSLKRNIDSGQIRSTIEFKRYVMLMCYNAIFYNVNDEVTCKRAKDMLSDALQLIAEFTVTWKKDSEKTTGASSSSSSSVTKSVRGRKSIRLLPSN
ncbi:bromodomain-containing protein 8 [Sitodiplosis mosellana]|uniref:bromodomain-containing protein 8 n=1 Tax=Sitodiplosis mosellana TaxID=263140 RepID=UPI0024449C04|nr:bromodomain-containing protein 8 [Sitodiplosis mosellana]